MITTTITVPTVVIDTALTSFQHEGQTLVSGWVHLYKDGVHCDAAIHVQGYAGVDNMTDYEFADSFTHLVSSLRTALEFAGAKVVVNGLASGSAAALHERTYKLRTAN